MKYMLVIVVLIITFSSMSAAQTDTSLSSNKTPEVLLWGGISIPYLPQEYRTFWKSGYNVGGGFGFSLDPGSIGYGAFYVTIEYGRTGFDTKGYNDSLKLNHPSDTAFGGPVKIVNVMLNMKAAFSSTKKSVAPFFLIGIGYMTYSQAEIYVAPTTSLTVAGINKGGLSWTVGLGIEVPVSDNARAFVQAKSILGVTDPSRQYFPITAGLTYVL
jgi:opacity protein-like surface antigen